MYYKSTCIFQTFFKRVRWLRVSKIKITTEKAFSRDYHENECNLESDNEP